MTSFVAPTELRPVERVSPKSPIGMYDERRQGQ